MFERFTESARKIVLVAQDESRKMKHATIGEEHVLLAMLDPTLEGSVAQSALLSCGLNADRVRAVVAGFQPEWDEPVAQPPFTPRAKQALEMALREALSLGHAYIGTEHVLLGLLRGLTVRTTAEVSSCLYMLVSDPEAVHDEVMRLLGSSRRADQTETPASRASTAMAEHAAASEQGIRRLRDVIAQTPTGQGLNVEERLQRIERYLGLS